VINLDELARRDFEAQIAEHILELEGRRVFR
jgi:hypothetical protein